MIIWFFVVLILTQSYTASFTSMLTVQQLKPTITDINELIRTGQRVGYQNGSFIFTFLKQMKFDESNLVKYDSPEQLDGLFSNGSRKGGIAAAFEEIPYMKLFLAKYCSKYTAVQPTYKFDGFGFVSLSHLNLYKMSCAGFSFFLLSFLSFFCFSLNFRSSQSIRLWYLTFQCESYIWLREIKRPNLRKYGLSRIRVA